MRNLPQIKHYSFFALCVLLALVLTALYAAGHQWALLPGLMAAALCLLGLRDMVQKRHAVLRNYPIIGHARFLFETIRPEIRQYLIESDNEELICVSLLLIGHCH